ncbi:TPA: hypothetical protein N6791_004803 [Escherichia coli]|uniref:hypothetical protein n=1 Tax=Escherichia coli TaxID=562 RepID=UPI00050BC764|nr:hypothetical protein [Escherichia coli]EFB2811439.1 hypothetical protein [Escherichia coli]EFO1377887.1 hypothetical protein [Escherichia coli]EFO1447691.1 hypothetical protein [Escherichia coli]EGO4468380.1 hypothetical protein [Escherichia coli]EGO7603540.1 hypothetical protein [Escherichia coli]
MRRPSVYENKGILQSPLKNAKQLLLINGKYHEATLKEGYYRKAILDSEGITRNKTNNDLRKIMSLASNFFNVNQTPASQHILSIRLCYDFYDFVVLASDPSVIFINKTENAEFGHTSISHGEPVLLAGELFFDKKNTGKLLFWTNKSGHYQVGSHLTERALKYKDMSLRSPQNMISHIQSRIPLINGEQLLPMKKFRVWSGEI